MANTLLDNGKLSSEFFNIQILEVNPKTDKIWEDRGTGGTDGNIAFWEVKPPEGFYTLGHLVTDFFDIDPEKKRYAPITIALSPKSAYADQNLLKEPSGFEEIWNDKKTGATYGDCHIWRMVCPEGYAALGDIVTKSSKQPQPGAVRCIKKTAVNALKKTVSLVASADYLNLAHESTAAPKALWTDKGSGSTFGDCSIWLMKMKAQAIARNQACLVAGTFRASRYHTIQPPSEDAHALLLNFPEEDIMEQIDMRSKKIKLKGPQLPTEEELKASEIVKEYYVPFFAVQDPNYKNQLEQFIASPTYKIRRTIRYEAIDSYEPINTETKEFSVMIGKNEESNYSNQVGITLGLSVTVGVSAGISAESGGAGAKIGGSLSVTASIEASYSHTWGGSTSRYEEKTHNYKQTVNAGCFGVLFQAKSSYTIYRTDNTTVGNPVVVKINEFYTDEWRPDNLVAKAEKSPEKTASPNAITFTIEAPAGKTIILEGRLEIHDGQVTSLPTVVNIPTVFSDSVQIGSPVGKSVLFDENTKRIVLPCQHSSSYTKEAWIKLRAANNSSYICIVSDTPMGRSTFGVSNQYVCAGHNGHVSATKCEETLSENWEHVAVTYDTDKEEMILYKNGQMVNSGHVAPDRGSDFVQIGSVRGNKDGDIFLFMGEMAEVRIWNYARSQAEIAAQMNVSIPKNTTGLLAKYPED